MNVHATIDSKWQGLRHPNGDPVRLNHQDFVAIDRNKDATYEATYRPQALYNRVNEGFHAKFFGFRHCSVVAGVVDEQNEVDVFMRDVAVGAFQGLFGAIGR